MPRSFSPNQLVLQVRNIYGVCPSQWQGGAWIISLYFSFVSPILLKVQFTVKVLLTCLPFFAKVNAQIRGSGEVIACKTNEASLKQGLLACISFEI